MAMEAGDYVRQDGKDVLNVNGYITSLGQRSVTYVAEEQRRAGRTPWWCR